MTPARRLQLNAALALGALGLGVSVLVTVIPPERQDGALPDGGFQVACVIPDSKDGGEVDCYGFGPLGLSDGGPHWRGVNTLPARWAIGDACIETPCEMTAGRFLKWTDGGTAGRGKMEEDKEKSDDTAPEKLREERFHD